MSKFINSFHYVPIGKRAGRLVVTIPCSKQNRYKQNIERSSCIRALLKFISPLSDLEVIETVLQIKSLPSCRKQTNNCKETKKNVHIVHCVLEYT